MTTTHDFRAISQELLHELCCSYRSWDLKEGNYSDAMKRANAALATPPPEPPTDMALEPSFSQRQQLFQGLSHCFCNTSAHMYLKVWIRDYARAALERWGHG